MEEEYEIDLKDILRIIRKRKWLLITLPIIAMAISAIISFYVLTPVYQATTTIMVSKQYTGDVAAAMQYQDLMSANQLVKTYSEIAQSRTVTEKVLAGENLNLTPEQFGSKIEVGPVKDTQLIAVNVSDPNPGLAAHLANKVAVTLMGEVQRIMKMDNVQLVDAAAMPGQPIKPKKALNVAIAGVVGLMLACLIAFLLEFLDQTIKSSDDVNRKLDLSVLGSIPKM